MSTAQDLTMVDEAPYFFLSYARTPRLADDHGDPDKWVAKLYADLCENVIQFARGKSAAVGFMDREMHTGAHWPGRLAQALACCRVFVPLYSPRYFESEECGKEWYAFARRVAEQAARRDQPLTEVILPALWVPVDPTQMPMVAKAIQFNHQSLGSRYSVDGFWGIMKVKRYKSDYQIAVQGLARRIVQVALQTMLDRESPVDFMSLTSAFDDRVDHRQPDSGERPPPEGPRRSGRRIQIIIAAPSAGDLPEGRRSPIYYGASACEWDPYHPESKVPLADFAADVTKRLGFRPAVVAFDEQPNAGAAELAPAPGLFLPDPWAAATDGGAARLREFDERAERWINVLMPWNRADHETVAAEPVLRPRLTAALANMLSRTPPEYSRTASRISTLDEFAAIVAPMARIAENRFLNNAPAFPPAGPVIPRPTLGPNPLAIPKEDDE